MCIRGNVDRIFDRETVRRPRSIRARIGVAENLAHRFRYQAGKITRDEHIKTARHLVGVGRVKLERRRPVPHCVGVDVRDCGDVGGQDWAN